MATIQVLLLVAWPSSLYALNCYTTASEVAPISIDATPSRELGCDFLMDASDETGAGEAQAKLQRTDEENYKNLPTCYTSCNGATRDTATCTYSCTRQESCLLMQQISESLQATAQVEAATGAACEGDVLTTCKPKFYFHRCCMDSDLCNSSDGSKSRPFRCVVVTALLLAYLLFVCAE